MNQLAEAVALAVKRMRQTAAGASALAGWIGEGAHPVAQELAETRADTCSKCPQNVRRKKVENKLAEGIRIGEEARSGLRLRTSHDHELRVCESCGCYLPLKVWVPLQNQTKADFPGNCWVVKEKLKPPVEDVQEYVLRRRFSIRRTAAFGDVILASIVSDKLSKYGDVRFATSDSTRIALKGHEAISAFLTEDSACTVNLDGCYETSDKRTTDSIAQLMIESANRQLGPFGVKLTTGNRVPNLKLFPEEIEAARQYLASFERPFTMIVPRSGSWPNRRVRECDLQEAASKITGTKFWAFPGRAPAGINPLKNGTFRDMMAFVSLADLVITPDTGPLHVAAAFNRPIIYLTTCNDVRLRISDQSDFTAVDPALDCIKCGHFACPINEKEPPCNKFSATAIAEAANRKLGAQHNGKVAAVIPVHRTSQRLFRTLSCVATQVNEIVIAFDHGAVIPNGLDAYGVPVTVMKPTSDRLGYGKNCNRAVRASASSNILFLNDDCYLNPGSVNEMLKVMDLGNAGVVGCKLFYPDGTIQHGGCTRNHGDIGFGHIDHRSRTATIEKPTAMEAVTFAAALVRRKLFYQVRGFDEDYDCYSEDADFCMKAREAGWSVWYSPDAIGIHEESQSTSQWKLQMMDSAGKIFRQKWANYFLKNPVL